MNEPDFYLASAEGYDLEAPRGCWRIRRVSTEWRDDLLLVRIEPALIGQKYGLGARNIDHVLLAPRHEGDSLFPVGRWPLHVHVARALVEQPEERESFHSNEMELIAWGELYQTFEDACLKAL